MRLKIEDLLELMKSKPSVFGWNAIVAYDRLKANKVLAQDYIARFSQQEGYMPKLSGTVPTTEGELEVVYDYLMDAPRLSFVNSNITSSKALLTMKVLGGSQFTITTESGRDAAVSKVAEYDALQAIPYTMDIDLMTSPGSIDAGGKVVLNLQEGYVPQLYFGPTSRQREEGGKFMLNKFKSMKPVITTYVLNEMKSQEDQFLKVHHFDIKTHKEPGSLLASAENYGDGEVLIFITMEDEANGTLPITDDDMNFLIPQGEYSSTMVLGQRFLMGRILAEGLKEIADGSDFAYKLNGPVDSFISDLEITEGQYQGAPIASSSPKLKSISLSGFVLPMIGKDKFSLSVVQGSGLLQLDWNGSAPQVCTLTPLTGDPIEGHIDASWRFSVRFEFALVGDDGELSLIPIAAGKVEQLKIAPGSFATGAISDAFHEVSSDLEPRLLAELNACMAKFGTVVTRIDAFRLNSLLFRGENIVRFTRSSLPGDLALFGTLAPEMDVFDISPQEYIIGHGGEHTFTTVPATAVTWEVEKIEGNTCYAGTITSAGVYTAPVKSELDALGLFFLRVRIKATGSAGTVAYALVTVVTRPISINPLVTACNASTAGKPQTREFAAGALEPGKLVWSVAGNTGSSFTDSAVVTGGQTYTARPVSEVAGEIYTLDEVVVTDAKGVHESSWVLVVHGLTSGQIKIAESAPVPERQVQFEYHHSEGLYLDVVWTLLKGGGQIDSSTGVYTSIENSTDRFALITSFVKGPPGWPAASNHFILPLPLTDLPTFTRVLEQSDVYFKMAAELGMEEAARLAGFND